MTRKYAFFRGCFIPSRAPHIEYVARETLPKLGIGLIDLDGFTCCPEPTGFSIHEKLTWLTIAARNLTVAEEQGLDIITICNGCYYSLKHTYEELEDLDLRNRVNEVLAETGREYKGTSDVKHFIQVLKEDVGIEKIKASVKVPLKGLKVATHVGCHFANRFGEYVHVIDELVAALGAESIDYDLKNLCCGWTLGVYGEQDEEYTWLKNRFDSMTKAEADCVNVICPTCWNQLDTGQFRAARKVDIPHKTPVLFYLQLLGLAMGYSIEEMQLRAHRIKDAGFEEKLGSILHTLS